MSFALLLLRLALGGALLAQGGAKLTRDGRTGTAAFFADVGLVPARQLALVAGITEVVTGVMLIAGFGTVLASAGALGVLSTAAVVNWRNGYWNSAGGAEYPLVAAAIGAALAFTGAGAVSLDELIGWSSPSTATAVAAVLLSVVTAAPVLVLRHRRRSGAGVITLAPAHEGM